MTQGIFLSLGYSAFKFYRSLNILILTRSSLMHLCPDIITVTIPYEFEVLVHSISSRSNYLSGLETRIEPAAPGRPVRRFKMKIFYV